MFWHLAPGAQLDCQLVVNDCHVEVRFSKLDLNTTPAVNAIAFPAADLALQHEVIVE